MERIYANQPSHLAESEMKTINVELGNNNVYVEFEGAIHLKIHSKGIYIKQLEKSASRSSEDNFGKIRDANVLVPSFQNGPEHCPEHLNDEEVNALTKQSSQELEIKDTDQPPVVEEGLPMLVFPALCLISLQWYFHVCRYYRPREMKTDGCEIVPHVGDFSPQGVKCLSHTNHIQKTIRHEMNEDVKKSARKFTLKQILSDHMEQQNGKASLKTDNELPVQVTTVDFAELELEPESLRSLTPSLLSAVQNKSYERSLESKMGTTDALILRDGPIVQGLQTSLLDSQTQSLIDDIASVIQSTLLALADQAGADHCVLEEHSQPDIASNVATWNGKQDGAIDMQVHRVNTSSQSQKVTDPTALTNPIVIGSVTVRENKETQKTLAISQAVLENQSVEMESLKTQMLNENDVKTMAQLKLSQTVKTPQESRTQLPTDTNSSSHTGSEMEEMRNQKIYADAHSHPATEETIKGNNVLITSAVSDVQDAAVKSCSHFLDEEKSDQTEHETVEVETQKTQAERIGAISTSNEVVTMYQTNIKSRLPGSALKSNLQTSREIFKKDTGRKCENKIPPSTLRQERKEDWWKKLVQQDHINVARKKWFGSEERDSGFEDANFLTQKHTLFQSDNIDSKSAELNMRQVWPRVDKVSAANLGPFIQHRQTYSRSSPSFYKYESSKTHSHEKEKSKMKMINPAKQCHSSKYVPNTMDPDGKAANCSAGDKRQYPPDANMLESKSCLSDINHVHVTNLVCGHSTDQHNQVYAAENPAMAGGEVPTGSLDTSSALQADPSVDEERRSSSSNVGKLSWKSPIPGNMHDRTADNKVSTIRKNSAETIDRRTRDLLALTTEDQATDVGVRGQDKGPSDSTSKNGNQVARTTTSVGVGLCSACVSTLMDHTGDDWDTINIKEEILTELHPESFPCRLQTAYGLALWCLPRKQEWKINVLMRRPLAPHETVVHNVLKELTAEGMRLGHVVEFFAQDESKRMDIVELLAKMHRGCRFCSAYLDTYVGDAERGD